MLLTILGIGATIIFGLLGIVYVLKYRERVSLTYMEEDCIPLFRSIVKNMDGIDISYNNQRITPSLTLLKGCFINTGNKDIDKSIIHEPISLTLPENNKWLKTTTVSTSPGVQALHKIRDDSTLEFSWDLLKQNEFIKFDALIHAEEETADKVGSLVKFSQRITNLDKVERTNWPKTHDLGPFPSVAVSRYGMLWTTLIFLIVTAFPIALFSTLKTSEIHYFIEEEPGKTVEVSYDEVSNGDDASNGVVRLRGVSGNLFAEMRYMDFIRRYGGSKSIIVRVRSIRTLVEGGVFSLLLISLFTSTLLRIRHARKVRKLMQAS
jgi:hypothetical protein